MVRILLTPIEAHTSKTFLLSSPIAAALALLISATLLVAFCAKHASQRHVSKAKHPNNEEHIESNATKKPDAARVDEEENAGVWQKAIMMGERCQPPEFSGVIYYDYSGNRVPEMPKSPRAAFMSPLRSFNVPAEMNVDSV